LDEIVTLEWPLYSKAVIPCSSRLVIGPRSGSKINYRLPGL
jgi:hypothetical protein